MVAPDVTRRQARRDAMVVLYQHDITGTGVEALYNNLKQESGHTADGFTREEVSGVLANLAETDAAIDAASRSWPAHRLAALERSILRLGVYEIKRRDDIPAEVSIDEAVSLAKRFCSREAAALVNGVLGNVAAGREGRPGADPEPKAKD
ncbi:MAG: transcription antitermination factor NusB [Thermoleophilia bacterium]